MELDIRRYLRLVARWWWLLVVSAVIPMAVSYHFVSQQSDLYQAKATIMVGSNVFQDPDPDPREISLSNTLAAAYAELVRQGPVVEAVIGRLGLDRTPEKLASQIATGIRSGAQLLEIYVTDTNPEAAAVIANALADELIRRSPSSGGNDPEQQEFVRGQLEGLQAKIARVGEEIDTLTASLSELTSAAELQDAQDRIAALEEVRSLYQSTYAGLLDVYRVESPNVLSLFEPAVVPQWPMPKKTELIVASSGAAGVLLAVVALVLMEYLDTSLRWEGDGTHSVLGLSVLGAIPQVPRKADPSSIDPLSPVTDSIRNLRTNVFLKQPDKPLRTFLLTSTISLEGKSSILANLAVVLASAGNRVIVVDGDMRRPSLHELFDCPNVMGLAEILADYGADDGTDSGDLVSVPLQETGFENVCLLSAGRPLADSATLLSSPRFLALLECLRGQGDIILIDSPPVLRSPDAAVLATRVDGTAVVVSTGITKRDWIEQAKDRLLAYQGVNLLGLIVNRVKLNSRYCYCSSDQRGKESMRRIGDSDGDWLKLSDAAVYLGVNKATVRRWCKTGRLPTRRAGLGLQVGREAVEQLQVSKELG